MKTQWLVFMILLLVSVIPVLSISFAASEDDGKRIVEDYLYEYAQPFPNGTELAIAIIVGTSERYIGIKRQNNTLVHIDNKDRIFEIASISKAFTSSILAKFVADSLISLDEPIKNLLPFRLKQSAKNDNEITVLHLANHHSGLAHFPASLSGLDKEIEEKMFVEYLTQGTEIITTPGERYAYSNLGASLLAYILCHKSDRTYDEMLKEYICKPLTMTNTAVNLSDFQSKQLVKGLDPVGKPAVNFDSNVFAGSGGIKSTAVDLVKYVRATISDSLFLGLTQETTAETDFDSEINDGIGLGWHYKKIKDTKYYFHHGGTAGYSCGIRFEKESEIGVVILSNVSCNSKYVNNISTLLESVFRTIYDECQRKSEGN